MAGHRTAEAVEDGLKPSALKRVSNHKRTPIPSTKNQKPQKLMHFLKT